MKYLEWNNVVSKHLFNPLNAGQDTPLYITKADIINIAKKEFQGLTEDEVWEDFLNKLKVGLPGSSGYPHIIDKAIHKND